MRISTTRKLLFTSVLILLALGVCEALVRARAWMKYGSTAATLRDPMLTYDPASELWLPTPGYEVKGSAIHIKINSLGFRGDEFSRAKPPGTFRIVCLGASTTFGSEASSNATTWPHLLQERLREALPGRNIEVINASVSGFVAADNLKNLRHRVLPLDPDLVIFYEANNEIVRDTRELGVRDGLLTADGSSPAIVRTFSRYSLLFDLAYKNIAIIARQRTGSAATMASVPRDLPERFMSILDEMRATLAEHDVPLLLSTFTVKYRRDQDRATQLANADVAFFYMPWMSIEAMLDAMDLYNEAILAYGRRTGVPVVDDRYAVPADAEHFVDCMHLTDRGNRVMAERFIEFLHRSNLGPFPPAGRGA